MREIKFRAWDKVNKIMVGIRSIHFDTSVKIVACYCNIDHRGDNPIVNFELMQFTGLKDKNGKEIYEGDIANISHIALNPPEQGKKVIEIKVTERGIMKFNQKSAQFSFLIEDSILNEDMQNLEVEVIGNVWENPELLKGL